MLSEIVCELVLEVRHGVMVLFWYSVDEELQVGSWLSFRSRFNAHVIPIYIV